MAFRSLPLRIPGFRDSTASQRSDVRARLRTWPENPKTTAWRIVMAPFWLGSEIPSPMLPERSEHFPDGGPVGNYVLSEINRIRRRIWLQRSTTILARCAVLVVFIALLWQVWELLGGSGPSVEAIALSAVPVVMLGVVFAITSRPTSTQIGRMLDRSFGLHERVTTALHNIGTDVYQGVGQPGIVYRQVADAANAITVHRQNSAFGLHAPIREVFYAIVLALLFSGLFLLRGGGGSIPPVEENVVPVFVSASERYVQQDNQPVADSPADTPMTPDEIEQWIDDSNEARKDLETLGDALDDHALTHQISNMIENGDYAQAAQELRDSGKEASEMSESDRQSLSEDLRTASENMAPDSALSEASANAADELQSGGPDADQAMQSLGDAVDETADRVSSPEEIDQARESASASSPSDANAGSAPAGQPQAQQDSLFSSETANQPGSSTDSRDATSGSEPSDPSGADAAAGVGEQASDPGSASAEQPGDSASGNASEPNGVGQKSSNDASSGTTGQASEESGNSQSSGAEGQGEKASDGSGAGGSSDSQDQQDQAEGGGDANQTQNPNESKEPPDPDVTNAEAADGEQANEVTDPRQAVSLAQDQQGEVVQLPGSSGTSSLGSGAGVTISGGSGTQGEVAVAGPDSNHVPSEYRNAVESYFSDGENE